MKALLLVAVLVGIGVFIFTKLPRNTKVEIVKWLFNPMMYIIGTLLLLFILMSVSSNLSIKVF